MEVLSTVDYLSPKSDTSIAAQLDAFHIMADPNYKADNALMTPENLYRMLQSGGASKHDTNMLLKSMMDWDDCDHEPQVLSTRFNEELLKVIQAREKQALAARKRAKSSKTQSTKV